jgi:serine phosphatase RsbU (regulator of sigma subunit)
MQFALLPETMPAVMGVTIGWHYQPGGDTSNPIGGDWLALVPIANDRVGIAVGDVAGHGLEDVGDMAQYRFALRTLAAQGAAPTIVMAAVDDLARKFNIPYFSTCAYGIIDTTKETWLYSVAGHPPPFLLRAAQPQLLDGPHGPPLAAPGTAGNYREHVVPLKDGDLLALYSDGLIERRGESLSKGMERLGERLGAVGSHDDLSAASRAVVADLVGDASSDDVVIILARYKTAATTSAC